MATIVLQAAGAAIGGLLGPVGGIIGAAIGGLAGYAIDQVLLNGGQHIEGPRLSGARPFFAEEGVAMPRVYGAARVGGIMIWATRFEEEKDTSRPGGKTGPEVTEYSYFANVAFALCEGPVAGVRRVWADGRELDLTQVELRIHVGDEAQAVDPLISARQGLGNAPAYRGTAYAVLEYFPLADYGNRIPQFQFEVLRPVGEITTRIRAVALIPGATEYGLSPEPVTRKIRDGETVALNRHVMTAQSDLSASLDELQLTFPNLERVALVVAWYGDDLRAGSCRIRPAVTFSDESGLSDDWLVSGVDRDSAMVVSSYAGGAAYGGTPSDRSVMDAIAEIKRRGLKVALYPFIMMDVPGTNTLPNPYGGTGQPAYPWRGRITCHPAPGLPGTADKTAAARTQVAAFCGAAVASQFDPDDDTIDYEGSEGEWGFRRFVLHHAKLAQAAGGVDAFVICSELRGLTTLRDGAGAFPFVEKLCQLAEDTRPILGPSTKITYGADWSEYFGHQPADGSGDAIFHLDPLWAHPEIDAVGIDNYMPLSDWQDGDYLDGNPDGFAGPCDPDGLRAAIASGEGFDWYYPSAEARQQRERAPIADGAYGKPWIYRYKDLTSWWSQPHHDRIGGVEAASPTAWMPGGKPIWFTELGCPAVDKGPNQPNVFPDPKSAESALPYFSSGGRSDIAQRRFLEAHAAHWDPASASFEDAGNPVSPHYGGRMVDASRLYVWAWDARPFPAFPLRTDQWADHANWHYGHWLNGRIAAPSVGELINAILADHGLPPARVEQADGTVQGYIIYDPTSARAAIEPIANLFGLAAIEDGEAIAFRGEGGDPAASIEIGDLATEGDQPALERVRTPDHQLPVEAVLAFRDPMSEYQSISTRQVRFGETGSRQRTIDFPGALEPGQGRALANDWLRRMWGQRERVAFALAAPDPDVVPGVVVTLPQTPGIGYLVTEVEDGLVRKVAATEIVRAAPTPWRSSTENARTRPALFMAGPPLAIFMDLPSSPLWSRFEESFRVAAWQQPWRRQTLFASPESTGFALRTTVTQQATLGTLAEALPTGEFSGRIDRTSSITVALAGGALSSVSRTRLLNGANSAAIRSTAGGWEVVQFEQAEEIAPNLWRLSSLLRGQLGTEDAMAAGAAGGADFVLLDDAVRPAGLKAGEAGLALNWRIGPSGYDLAGGTFVSTAAAGGLRSRLPLSPVHLKSKAAGADTLITWIRRGRIDADDWTSTEIPLGEEREEYRIEIAAAGGDVVRSATVGTPQFTYDAAAIADDFGTPPDEIDVTVRQLSVAVGWGIPATARLTLT